MKDKKQAQAKPFKIGDKIVEFGQVHRVFKIKKKKDSKGRIKKVICYRHYYKTPINGDLSYSIPTANIAKTNLRRPISEKELKQLLKKLSKRPRGEISFSTAKMKAVLNLNNPGKTIQVLRSLWWDKNDEAVSFSKTRQDVFELAMKRLVEEVALVSAISLSKARREIHRALNEMME